MDDPGRAAQPNSSLTGAVIAMAFGHPFGPEVCRSWGYVKARQLPKIDLHRGNGIPPPRDKAPQKPANCGLLGRLREISRLERMRGGPRRIRTSNQTVMSEAPTRADPKARRRRRIPSEAPPKSVCQPARGLPKGIGHRRRSVISAHLPISLIRLPAWHPSPHLVFISIRTTSNGLSPRFSGRCLPARFQTDCPAFTSRSSDLPSGSVNLIRPSARIPRSSWDARA
jgi:hypothetical protein